MKVLHVIDSLEPAGAERSLVAMVPALQSHGVRSAVVHFGAGPGLADELRVAGTDVVRISARGRWSRIWELSQLVGRVRPDLIHTSLFEADIAGRLAAARWRVPVVSSLVTMQYGTARREGEGLPAWKVAAARAMDAATAQFVTRFHAITEAAGQHGSGHLRVSRRPIEVIPRGRSDAALGRRSSERRSAVRSSQRWRDDEHVLLAVARQEPQKGLDVLLEAVAQLRRRGLPLRLVLAGRPGSASTRIRRLVDELGLAEVVEQLGVRDDVADLMVGADVLVLPSRWEGLGGVLLEAMALELPIVASDLAPIAEVAPPDEVALLAPPGDAIQLAEAIAASISDPAASAERTARGRARFEARYTIEAVAEQMAGFYQRALRNSGRGNRRALRDSRTAGPIRVAHVVWRLSPTGGIPRVVRDLSVGLDPREVELHVLSVRPRDPEDDLDAVIEPDRFRSADYGLGASRLGLAVAMIRLTRHLRTLRPDVIHLHSGTSWLATPAALTLPSAHRVLEVHDEPQAGRSRRANVAVMRFCARHLGFHVLVHSTVVRSQTAAAFGVPDSEITLIPLGIDVHRYRPDLEARRRGRESLGLADDRPLVVWVGRVEPLKRPQDAVAVARAVRDVVPGVVFAIAGSGSSQEELVAGVGSDDFVRILGHVDDLPALLNAGDVFLSTSGYEGFGLSVAEAMACGLPVVSTRAGGVVDLVADGMTGHLVDIGDVDGAAGRIVGLLRASEQRQRMCGAARHDALERFSRQGMIASYIATYTELVDGPRRSDP